MYTGCEDVGDHQRTEGFLRICPGAHRGKGHCHVSSIKKMEENCSSARKL